MLQKKICMLGSFAVGKTSLVSRYVNGTFSEKYLTTIGVKIDRKDVEHSGQTVRLLLWDIHGDDEFQKICASYLRGMSGYLLVIDGTRPETLSVGMELHRLCSDAAGKVPFIVLLNKADLTDSWQLDFDRLSDVVDQDWVMEKTIAKTGENVESAFRRLTHMMLDQPD